VSWGKSLVLAQLLHGLAAIFIPTLPKQADIMAQGSTGDAHAPGLRRTGSRVFNASTRQHPAQQVAWFNVWMWK